MRKRILKNGNSYAVILPVAYLELLGIDKDKYKDYTVEIMQDFANRCIVIKDGQKS